MPAPTNKEGVQRLLGTVNYFAKFVPNMSEITAPLRTLMRTETEWSWDPNIHGRSFDAVKKTVQNAPVLKYFDNRKPVVVQCDASQSGLGCALMQDGSPLAYGSRVLSVTEQMYAQIEKKCLAIVFAMEKFHTFVYGRVISVETDHKPLISIFSKALNNAPRRLQRMMLRLQNYQFEFNFQAWISNSTGRRTQPSLSGNNIEFSISILQRGTGMRKRHILIPEGTRGWGEFAFFSRL